MLQVVGYIGLVFVLTFLIRCFVKVTFFSVCVAVSAVEYIDACVGLWCACLGCNCKDIIVYNILIRIA